MGKQKKKRYYFSAACMGLALASCAGADRTDRGLSPGAANPEATRMVMQTRGGAYSDCTDSTPTGLTEDEEVDLYMTQWTDEVTRLTEPEVLAAMLGGMGLTPEALAAEAENGCRNGLRDR